MNGETKQFSDDPLVQQYHALLQVSEAIVAHKDLASLFQDLAERLPLITPYDFLGILLYDGERQVMRLHSLTTPWPLSVTVQPEVSVDTSPSGVVWRTQEPLFIDVEQETRFQYIIELLRSQGMKVLYLSPLTSANHRLGAMGFGSKEVSAFSESGLTFLNQVARQVAVAVDNVLNFASVEAAEKQLRQDRDRLKLLLDVNNSVTANLDLRELFKNIAEALRRAIAYDGAGLTIYDNENRQLRVYALESQVFKQDPLLEGTIIPIDNTPGEVVFASRKTTIFRHERLKTLTSPMVHRLLAQGIKTGCIAPLISHGQIFGSLNIVSLQEDAFTQGDAELMTQIAGQVAIAVENAINFEKARVAEQALTRERNRLRLLLDISNRLTSRLNLQELLEAVSSCLREVIHHTAAVLLLYDAESKCLRVHALDAARTSLETNFQVPISTGNPSGLAFVRRQPSLVRRIDFNEFPDAIVKRAYEDGTRSGCNVPLISNDRALGVLTVVSHLEDAFDTADLEFLTQIANQVAIAVENAIAYREIETLKNKLAEEKLYLEEEIQTVFNFEEIIGQSAALKRILKQIETVAPTDSTILIQGETGTGKELIARAIHKLSLRQAHTLVKLNCAAIPTGLLESELFGHEKGAFTGAIAQRIGRFELAHRGTLFLDEVGDIPLELQPKLLRVLQEQEFERLGSSRTIKVNTRLVAATNCDLAQMVAEKKYRSDLYYRLNVFPIQIPALRERPQDITLLARFFAQKFARHMKKRIETIPLAAQEALLRYRWPGNVRELENLIERAVILTQGSELEINLNDLPANIEAESHSGSISTLETAERQHILRALQESHWVIGGATGAAARLGMKRTTLQSRMQKLGITRSNG
jgi:formate hydrogenlyase transcriptional activator